MTSFWGYVVMLGIPPRAFCFQSTHYHWAVLHYIRTAYLKVCYKCREISEPCGTVCLPSISLWDVAFASLRCRPDVVSLVPPGLNFSPAVGCRIITTPQLQPSLGGRGKVSLFSQPSQAVIPGNPQQMFCTGNLETFRRELEWRRGKTSSSMARNGVPRMLAALSSIPNTVLPSKPTNKQAKKLKSSPSSHSFCCSLFKERKLKSWVITKRDVFRGTPAAAQTVQWRRPLTQGSTLT